MGSSTRRLLLDRARTLFNEHGLESVGVRELARDLGLSPGNVSYHFARKADLIEALMDELTDRNRTTFAQLVDARRLVELLGRYRSTFEAQYDYRCIVRGIVHIVDHYPALATRYRDTEVLRRRGLAEALSTMVGGELRSDTTEADLALIVGTFTLVARFWLSEARISFEERTARELIDHYLALLTHAVWKQATPTARDSLRPLLDGILVDPVLGRSGDGQAASRPRPAARVSAPIQGL